MQISYKPQDSKNILQISRRHYLYVEIPHPGLTGLTKVWMVIVMVGLAEGFAMMIALNSDNEDDLIRMHFLILYSIAFLGAFGYFGFHILSVYTRQILHIGRQTYGVWTERCFSKQNMEAGCQEEPDPSRALGRTRNLNLAALIPARKIETNNGTKIMCPYIEIREGIRKRKFGDGTTKTELESILKKVNESIGKLTEAEHIGATLNTRVGIKTSQSFNQNNLEIGNKPQSSKVILKRSRRNYLYVEIPPAGWTWRLTFSLIFMVFMMYLLTSTIVSIAYLSADPSNKAIQILVCSTVTLVVLGTLAHTISVYYTRKILHIGRQTYGAWTEICFTKQNLEVACQEEPDPSRALGSTRNLKLSSLIPAPDGTDTGNAYIEVRGGIGKSNFGKGLDLIDLEWILTELNEVIVELTGSNGTLSVV